MYNGDERLFICPNVCVVIEKEAIPSEDFCTNFWPFIFLIHLQRINIVHKFSFTCFTSKDNQG